MTKKNIVGRWLWFNHQPVFIESKLDSNPDLFVVKFKSGQTQTLHYDRLAQSVFISHDLAMSDKWTTAQSDRSPANCRLINA